MRYSSFCSKVVYTYRPVLEYFFLLEYSELSVYDYHFHFRSSSSVIFGLCEIAIGDIFTFGKNDAYVFSERVHYYVIARQSVCRLSSVTFVHPTQAIEIFGNVSTPFGTFAICDPSVKILRRFSRGTPPSGS